MARRTKNLGSLNLYLTHVDTVARKAAAVLLEKIHVMREKAIKEAMERRFLWFKPKTREEAIKHVDRSPTPHDCYIPDWTVQEIWLEDCYTLLSTALNLRELGYARMSISLEAFNNLLNLAHQYDIQYRGEHRENMMRRVSFMSMSEIQVKPKAKKPKAEGETTTLE